MSAEDAASINIKNVSRETLIETDQLLRGLGSELMAYIDLLLWWNKKINLISRNAGRSEIKEHVRHSLLPIGMGLYGEGELVVDTGSGGGLPGLPLAIALPNHRFVLNDISSKKCLVLKQIVKTLGLLNCEVVSGDLAEIKIKESCTLTSKHAFKLGELFIRSNQISWRRAIIYKGSDYLEEIKRVDCDYSIQPYDLSKLSPHSFYNQKHILIVSR